MMPLRLRLTCYLTSLPFPILMVALSHDAQVFASGIVPAYLSR